MKKLSILIALALLLVFPMGNAMARGPFGGTAHDVLVGTAHTWTEDQTMADDKAWIFGTGSDLHVEWDNTNGWLQFGDGTNDFIRLIDSGTTCTAYFLGTLYATTYGSDGSVTDAELKRVDATSSIQTQLDARCLKSVLGDAIEADDFVLSGTTLSLVTEIPHLDVNETVTGNWTFPNIYIDNGGVFRSGTTTTAHAWAIQIYDVDNTTWRDALTFTNGDTPTISIGAGVTLDGLGALNMGGVILGDSTPDAAGEVGYTSSALKYYNTALREVANLDESQTFTNKTLTTPVIASISNTGTVTLPTSTDTLVGKATTDVFTNKTFDANATGNVAKGFGYITLKTPNQIGSDMTTVTTTDTNINYGMPAFDDAAAATNNWMQWFIEVPRDIDTSVDLEAWFKYRLGGTDTGTHHYIISMVDIADSAVQAGTPANPIPLLHAGDVSGATGEIETVTSASGLTDWKSNAVAGTLWMIRLARSGDGTDASTVNSYPVELTIRYGFSQ